MSHPGSLPSLIASRYRVIRELGRGGMGTVYLVEHAHTGDHLALKLLHAHAGATPEVVARFKREARAPAQIKSEHVVKVIDADVAPELGGAPFLVMEALDGSDLEKLVGEHGPLPPSDVVGWLAQVARALDKAHAIGIVHRDLKPENLFLHRREDGSTIVKILDFGISKAMGTEAGGSATESGGLTKSGSVFGTPLYMAPEQARGQHGVVGPPTDQWAIGLIAYRLLTGKVYWHATTFAELVMEIIAEPMAPPSSRVPALGAAFDAWFARSCERDPGRRWRTVGAQAAALAEALGLSTPAPMIAPAPLPAPIGAQPLPAPAIVEARTDASTLESPGIGTTGSPLSRTTPRTETGTKSRVPALVAIGAVVVVGVAVTVGSIAFRTFARPAASAAASEEGPVSNAAAAPPSVAVLSVQSETQLPSASAPPSATAAPVSAGVTKATKGKALPGSSAAPEPPKPPPVSPGKAKPYSPEAP